jgi:hypothetical protein
MHDNLFVLRLHFASPLHVDNLILTQKSKAIISMVMPIFEIGKCLAGK